MNARGVGDDFVVALALVLVVVVEVDVAGEHGTFPPPIDELVLLPTVVPPPPPTFPLLVLMIPLLSQLLLLLLMLLRLLNDEVFVRFELLTDEVGGFGDFAPTTTLGEAALKKKSY